MEAVLNQKDDLSIAGKNKGKKSRALMRTLIITKSEDAQEMALFFMHGPLVVPFLVHTPPRRLSTRIEEEAGDAFRTGKGCGPHYCRGQHVLLVAKLSGP